MQPTATALLEPALPRSGKTWPKLLRLIRQWRQNARTRAQLAELDERALVDLGISPGERIEELSKPFWR